MLLKRKCCLLALPTTSCAAVGIGINIKKDVFPPDPAYTLWCFGEEMSVHLTHVCG